MAIAPMRNRACLYDRGGERKLGDFTGLDSIKWGRVRDDISESRITMKLGAETDVNLIRGAEPHRHELVVFRGEERVWEGPITLKSLSGNEATIAAKDVGHYLARTVMVEADSSSFPNTESAIQRLNRIIRRDLNRLWESADPPANIVPFIVLHETATDASTSSSTLAYQMTVHEHLDSMAWRGGIDYVVVGRALHLFDVNTGLGRTPTLTRENFTAEPVITYYGMEQASISYATDGQGNVGIAGEVDDYYGPWELLATAYDESSGELPPSIAELTSQAQRNQAGRSRTPAVVRIPDNSTLDLRGSLEMKHLVPGVLMPLRVEIMGEEIMQMQKLQSVTFTEGPDGEEIKVTLYPAADPDAVEV